MFYCQISMLKLGIMFPLSNYLLICRHNLIWTIPERRSIRGIDRHKPLGLEAACSALTRVQRRMRNVPLCSRIRSCARLQTVEHLKLYQTLLYLKPKWLFKADSLKLLTSKPLLWTASRTRFSSPKDQTKTRHEAWASITFTTSWNRPILRTRPSRLYLSRKRLI